MIRCRACSFLRSTQRRPLYRLQRGGIDVCFLWTFLSRAGVRRLHTVESAASVSNPPLIALARAEKHSKFKMKITRNMTKRLNTPHAPSNGGRGRTSQDGVSGYECGKTETKAAPAGGAERALQQLEESCTGRAAQAVAPDPGESSPRAGVTARTEEGAARTASRKVRKLFVARVPDLRRARPG